MACPHGPSRRSTIVVGVLAATAAPQLARAQPPPTGEPAQGPTQSTAGTGVPLELDEADIEESDQLSTPELSDHRKFKAFKDFPGSIAIPGTQMRVQIGGFAQVDVINDFKRIGTPDAFVVSSIPGTPGQQNKGVQASARQSRVFIKTETPLPIAPLETYLEVDFFDPQNDETLHLRHAYGQLGERKGTRLLGGQFWTNFMDATVWPGVLDFEGPPGILFSRSPQIRVGVPVGAGLTVSVSIEQPGPQLTLPATVTGQGVAWYPDITANVRWKHSHGHIQVGGLVRSLDALPATQDINSTTGWGAMLSGSFQKFWGKDAVIWQIAGGQGIAKYFNDTSGLGLDGFVIDEDIERTGEIGLSANYQHFWWSKTVYTNACYSFLRISNPDIAPPDTYHLGQYVAVDLIYQPLVRMLGGIEYLYGRRSNEDDTHASDHRIQASLHATF